jgi:thiosulfate/3-mercaptopyruvate sulfurtransferase
LTADPLLAPAAATSLLARATFLDVRWRLGRTDGHEQYLAGHVPGARYVDLGRDLADPVGDGCRGRHPLPGDDRFAAVMRRCGVSRDRTVVVYDDVSGTAAARAWWLLTYHGHRDVRLLDGGWSAYRDAGGPVESGETTAKQGDFAPDPGHLPVLDATAAAQVARNGVLVDARTAERYRGEAEPIDPVAGHIPGAVNVPTSENLARGRFRTAAELRLVYDRVFERAGADRSAGPPPQVGVYCGSGVTAMHDLFVLRRLGVPAALYPGSWSEWVSDPSRPVARA